MKKKNLLLLLIGILILLVGILAYQSSSTSSTASAEAEVSEDTSIELIKHKKEEIKQIEVTNEIATLTFIPTEDSWTLADQPSFALDDSTLKYKGGNLITITATRKIDSSDLASFGLDVPQKTVTYTLIDGTSFMLYVGMETADGKNSYVKLSTDDAIYLIGATVAENFETDINSLRTTTLDEITTDTITALKASGKTIDSFDISLNTNQNGYYMSYLLHTKDGQAIELDASTFPELLKLLPASIDIKSFVEDNPTDLSQYGLDDVSLDLYLENTTQEADPDAAPTTDAAGNAVTPVKNVVTSLRYVFGNMTEDGQVYFMKAGDTSVYTTDGAFLAPLLESFDFFNLISKWPALINIDTINKLDLTLNGTTYTYEIVRNGDTTTYMINGKSIGEDAFKLAYRTFIGVSADTQLKEATPSTKSPAVKAVFSLTDGTTKEVLFHPYSDTFYMTTLNGILVGCDIKQFSTLEALLKETLQSAAQ